MATTVAPNDSRLCWNGAVSLEVTQEWVQPWRIPYAQKELFPPAGLIERAAMSAGVRILFQSNTTVVSGRVVPFADPMPLELVCDGKLVGSVKMDGEEEFRFEGLPPGEKRIEIWLPTHIEFRLRSLELSDRATLARFQDDRPKWITYGSSITHCRQAESPTETWPGIVARGRGLNLTCLGFGGNCHLDPMIARMIRDLPADFISICCGINIYGANSLAERSFVPAIIGTVQTIREKHPAAPFVLMSPIFSAQRETHENAVGFTLRVMREQVEEAVNRLRAHGDENLHYVNGLDILGPDHADLLPDDLHPNVQGYKLMGKHFLEKVVPRVFPAE